jgi:hypothetical protein
MLLSIFCNFLSITWALTSTSCPELPVENPEDPPCKVGPLGDVYWCIVEGDWGLAIPEVEGGVVPFSNKL